MKKKHINIDKDTEIFSLKNIIALMPGNVYWLDKNGVYLGCNHNVAKILKLSSCDTIVGKTNRDLLAESYAKVADEINQWVMSHDKEHVVEEQGFNVHGEPAIYLSKKMPLHNHDGEVIGLLGISMDITERKQIEEALKVAKQKAETANQIKSQFLAMVSHEMRIPLTAILGIAKFMDVKHPSRQKAQIKQMIESGSYLLSLINNVLDFSKLEENQFKLSYSSICLNELIDETIQILSISAQQKAIKLISDNDNKIPIVLGDDRALKQILINLIGNAIKFTERGHIRVQLRCLEQNTTSIRIRIAVEDNGIGIPNDKLELIFDAFRQVEDVYTRKFGGTGIGLTITKKLVELMGGTIAVKSKVGEGSTFFCDFSFHTQPKQTTASKCMDYFSSINALIIDDAISNKKNYNILNVSYDVVSSKEALEKLLHCSEHPYQYNVVIVNDCLRNTDPLSYIQNITRQICYFLPLPLLLSNTLVDQVQVQEMGFFDRLESINAIELMAIWNRWCEIKEKLKTELKLNVLLIEDDRVVRFIHEKMLIDLNCNVRTAKNGKEAIQLAETVYDIIFADIGLPDINGFDVIHLLRQEDNKNCQTLIVILTGFSNHEERQRGFKAGADRVETKPVDIKKFEEILMNVRSTKFLKSKLLAGVEFE